MEKYTTTYLLDESALRVFKTAEDIAENLIAVELTPEGLKTAGASSTPLAIVTPYNVDIKAGDDVAVQVSGGGQWLAGEEIKAGDLLAAGEAGKAVKATEGKYAFGQAVKNAAAGEAVEMIIVRAGKV